MTPDRNLRDAIRSKDFVLTAQLQLNEDTGRDGVQQQARCLAASVDAITIPSHPHGIVHMAGLAAASLLIADGIDPVLHVASRDQNRMTFRSEILGAVAIGVTSLVFKRGDRLSTRLRPSAKTSKPRKISSVKMLKVAKQLGEYQLRQGGAELNLGALATVVAPADNWQPHALNAKVDGGAKFVQTKLCADVGLLRSYAAALVKTRLSHRCQIMVSVPVLPSAEAARWINERRGTDAIPLSVVQRLDGASSPETEGVKIAAEMLKELREIPGISGANLVTEGDIETIPAAINAAND